jgi:hypothetical protein
MVGVTCKTRFVANVGWGTFDSQRIATDGPGAEPPDHPDPSTGIDLLFFYL